MKTVRFLCSVASNDYNYGKGQIVEVDDSVANSEIGAGNAEFYDEDDVPEGLQKPKRKPEVEYPEVHTTVIKNQIKETVKKTVDKLTGKKTAKKGK